MSYNDIHGIDKNVFSFCFVCLFVCVLFLFVCLFVCFCFVLFCFVLFYQNNNNSKKQIKNINNQTNKQTNKTRYIAGGRNCSYCQYNR